MNAVGGLFQYKILFIKSVFLPRGRAHEYEHKQRHRPVGEVGPPWGNAVGGIFQDKILFIKSLFSSEMPSTQIRTQA